MDNRLQPTRTDTLAYSQGQMITSDCVAIEFYVPASGSVTYNTCYVNGKPITPGMVYSIGQTNGYIDVSNYELAFVGSDTSLVFVSRTYVID